MSFFYERQRKKMMMRRRRRRRKNLSQQDSSLLVVIDIKMLYICWSYFIQCKSNERKKEALTISAFFFLPSLLSFFFLYFFYLPSFISSIYLSLVDKKKRNIYKYIFLFRSTSSTTTNQYVRPVRINGKKRNI
jgi:hypothetical protein